MHRSLRLARSHAALCLAALLTSAAGSQPAAAPAPAIAAASDLQFALEEIVAAYRRDTGGEVRLAFGSSGNLTRQIEQGAPFELFFSADEAFVARLAERGLTRDAGELYAVGRLAIFAPHGSPLEPDPELAGLRRLLAAGGAEKIAIANPEHAPYGRAAEQALRSAGLWDEVEPRLLLGESVAQAAQFTASGNAAGGLIAHSLVLAPTLRDRGSFALVAEGFHEPLRQRMVLLARATAAAERFYAYVQSPPARTIFERYGFELPAADFVDDAGRAVAVPRDARRVFAAGAPADVLLYTLAPEQLVGRNYVPSEAALALMPPELRSPVLIEALPDRDDPRFDRELLELAPDLYIDYGTVSDDYIDSVAAVQARTGIPGIILDGALERIPATYRRLGALIGVPERGERLARETERVLEKYRGRLATGGAPVRIYLACSQNGLVPCLAGTANGAAAEWLGAVNVAGSIETAPRRPLTLAEIEHLNPDVIVAPSAAARDRWLADPAWQGLAAVRAGAVIAPPALPFGWGPRPPSVNRVPGLVWLAYAAAGRATDPELYADIRALFGAYYHIDLTDADIERLVELR